MQLSPFALLDHWLIPPPDPERVRWLGMWHYAHRGLHGAGLPENGSSAFAAAMARGMGIECDVQRSADGQPMVFHDANLGRMTGAEGAVIARSAEDLGKLSLVGSDDRIQTLRQLLAQIDGMVPLLVEVKTPRLSGGRVAALCLAVHRAIEGYRGDLAVMSFDPRVSRWFSRNAPRTLRGLVVTEENARSFPGLIRRRLTLWHARPQFLAYDIRDLPSRLASGQRRRGLPLLTWTVKTPELADRAALHADAPIAEGAGVV